MCIWFGGFWRAWVGVGGRGSREYGGVGLRARGVLRGCLWGVNVDLMSCRILNVALLVCLFISWSDVELVWFRDITCRKWWKFGYASCLAWCVLCEFSV